MDNSVQDKLENLKSHLVMIKSLKDAEAEDQFYVLLEKAKQNLGDMSPYIANFYFEYGSFLLNKIQKGMDILNAGAVPQGQQQQEFPEIAEAYDEQSQQEQNGANAEKKEKIQEKQEKQEEQEKQKVVYEDENVQITEEDKNQIHEKIQQNHLQIGGNQKDQQEQKFDDIQIAYQHFQVALKIYQEQRRKIENGQNNVLPKQQVDKHIIMTHSRLGDLYTLDEHFSEAIDQYHAVIKLQCQKQNSQSNRRIAQAHYMIGNCLLHQNKQNCEKLAIREYIDAVRILLKHMQFREQYDISAFEVPTQDRIRVDRFAYLNKPLDSELVQQIKEVISILLDKIEDTYEQIGLRKTYEQEKMKMNQQKEENTFKQVSKDVKVTNLGTFGNRKKTPAPESLSTPQKAQNGINHVEPPLSLKQKQKITTTQTINHSQEKDQNQSKKNSQSNGIAPQ